MDFPGTLSAEPRAYLDLLTGELENFIQHGFKRLILLNGHGGNMVPGAQVVFELRQKAATTDPICYCSPPPTGKTVVRTAARDDFVQTQMGHAGEWPKTSMMLVIRPELVGDHLEPFPRTRFGKAFPSATRGWTMPDRGKPGHIGTPAAATAEKGETLLTCFTDGVFNFLNYTRDWDSRSWEGWSSSPQPNAVTTVATGNCYLDAPLTCRTLTA